MRECTSASAALRRDSDAGQLPHACSREQAANGWPRHLRQTGQRSGHADKADAFRQAMLRETATPSGCRVNRKRIPAHAGRASSPSRLHGGESATRPPASGRRHDHAMGGRPMEECLPTVEHTMPARPRWTFSMHERNARPGGCLPLVHLAKPDNCNHMSWIAGIRRCWRAVRLSISARPGMASGRADGLSSAGRSPASGRPGHPAGQGRRGSCPRAAGRRGPETGPVRSVVRIPARNPVRT